MPRLGPGPVFVHESIAASRRWQHYALRVAFLTSLLVGLLLIFFVFRIQRNGLPQSTARLMVMYGQYTFYVVSTVQLAIVLLVAPAATAGAICGDRASGALDHSFLTDLSNAEIVLGKLLARLIPIVGLIASAAPILALTGLLGGVVPEAIWTLTCISLASAMFVSALALAFSVSVKKTQDALTAVYSIVAIWAASPILFGLVARGLVPGLLVKVNPFIYAWAPVAWPSYLSAGDYLAFVATLSCLAVFLTAYAVVRVRADLGNRRNFKVSKRFELSWRPSWWPSPSLDRNPILWREWHRRRPSLLGRIVWGLLWLGGLAALGTGFVMWATGASADLSQYFGSVMTFGVCFGLLLVSLSAPSSLAEERQRGGLDVLMASPLPTGAIVAGNWWGAYRAVLGLAAFSFVGAIAVAVHGPPSIRAIMAFPGAPPPPISLLDRVAVASIPPLVVLGQGAVVVSFGLLLATWFRKPSKALVVSVSSFVVMSLLWPVMLEIGFAVLEFLIYGDTNNNDNLWLNMVAESLFVLSPIGGQTTALFPLSTWLGIPRYWQWGFLWSGVAFLFLLATALYGLTLRIFDRSVGRVSDNPGKLRRAPVGQPADVHSVTKLAPHREPALSGVD